MLADADEVDEHRRIAARVETDGQARPRGAFAEPVTGQRVPGGGVVVPGRREGDDLCPAVVLFGAGPRLAGRRGARSRWALTGSTSGMTGFWSPGTPRSLHKGSENLVLDHLPGGPRAHRPGCVGRCHRPGQCPGRPACSPMGTNGSGTPHAARPGTATAPRR